MTTWNGGVITERAQTILADNPGIMTLDGTNTWVLREPGAARSIVVDPGPLDENHLAAVAEAAGSVALIVLTHWHLDHTEGAERFAAMTGAPVRALDSALCSGAGPLTDGEIIEVDGLVVEIFATPGHTTDSICLLIDAEKSLLSGDTILGRGTTVISHPDGVLGPYLASMGTLSALTGTGRVDRILPAHGPVIEDPAAVIDFYIAHREERLDQVRAALSAGDQTPDEVVARVYADVDQVLWPAARLSVEAQLEHLRTE